MSDGEAHPTLGGKSLESLQALGTRKPYKSYRKKYRKMRARFDAVLEENKRSFKEEQKLEGLARRLTEELDGLMDILLDVNQSSAIPPSMRYDVSLSQEQRARRDMPEILEPDVQPEHCNDIVRNYRNAIQAGRLPSLDLHVMREHAYDRLGQQNVQPLPDFDLDIHEFAQANNPEGHPSFLSAEQQAQYLARIDFKDAHELDPPAVRPHTPGPSHQADLTPRELERQLELLNPQSQHNWLKMHSKGQPIVDDDDALTDQPAKPSRKRPSGKNLAKQLGDRTVDRMMREGFSPSESGFGEDDGDDGADARKRGGDKDGSYRPKIKNGSTKGKRKRVTDEGGAGGGGKRMRASEMFEGN